MTLITKKWFYFNLIYISGGISGYLLGYMIKNTFSIGMIFTSLGLLMTSIASYIQWRFIIKKLKNDNKEK